MIQIKRQFNLSADIPIQPVNHSQINLLYASDNNASQHPDLLTLSPNNSGPADTMLLSMTMKTKVRKLEFTHDFQQPHQGGKLNQHFRQLLELSCPDTMHRNVCMPSSPAEFYFPIILNISPNFNHF